MDKETKGKIIDALEEKKMNKKEAIEFCEEYGWDITEGKYFLEWEEDRVVFQNDKELIEYAEMLKREREEQGL